MLVKILPNESVETKYETIYLPSSAWKGFLKKYGKKKSLGDYLRDANMFIVVTDGKATQLVSPFKPISTLLPKEKDHIAVTFNWSCSKCGRGWTVHDSLAVWKFCPYCDSEILVADVYTSFVQGYLDFCVTYIILGKILSSLLTFTWGCFSKEGESIFEEVNHCYSVGFTEDVIEWKFCPNCGKKLTVPL